MTFTPIQLWTGFLALCVAVVTISNAWTAVHKGKENFDKPNKDRDQRITDLEKRVARHDEFFAADKARLDKIEAGNRVTQRAILALLSHGINGNDIDNMREAKDELEKYLISQ